MGSWAWKEIYCCLVQISTKKSTLMIIERSDPFKCHPELKFPEANGVFLIRTYFWSPHNSSLSFILSDPFLFILTFQNKIGPLFVLLTSAKAALLVLKKEEKKRPYLCERVSHILAGWFITRYKQLPFLFHRYRAKSCLFDVKRNNLEDNSVLLDAWPYVTFTKFIVNSFRNSFTDLNRFLLLTIITSNKKACFCPLPHLFHHKNPVSWVRQVVSPLT